MSELRFVYTIFDDDNDKQSQYSHSNSPIKADSSNSTYIQALLTVSPRVDSNVHIFSGTFECFNT